MTPAARALDPVELARLASMTLRARMIVEGAYAGIHHNPHAGTSIEFAEHKEYTPGDDVRRIDWKVAGRVDRYYVKQFEDETEMRTFLCLDASASMGYRGLGSDDGGGGRAPRVSKLEYGSYLAAALGYLLGQQGDPAGLIVFDEVTRSYLPPRARPGHIRDLFSALEAAAPRGGTDPARALGHVNELAERRSFIALFTDLLDAAPHLEARLRQLRARGHDVVLFHILDPDEVDLPFEDLTHFEGVEPGDGRRLLADPHDLRAAFRRESLALREKWRLRCLEARAEYRFTTTNTPPTTVLRDLLMARQRLG